MKRKSKDRQDAGYRVVSGGRAIRIPILETVKRMDVTTTSIRIEIKNAYSKGNIYSVSLEVKHDCAALL